METLFTLAILIVSTFCGCIFGFWAFVAIFAGGALVQQLQIINRKK